MLKAVLFDLDGTLLPMDQEKFTGAYFKLLAAKMAPHGYDPKQLIKSIWDGTGAMVRNDGSVSNEKAFWKRFTEIYGDKAERDRELFDEFYRVEFQGARSSCGYNPEAAAAVRAVKSKGLRTALATNPIFPSVATEHRMEWAGVSEKDFEFYTSYENSRFCKPNPMYYLEVADRLGLKPDECLMVGNDAEEDAASVRAGMDLFLITDCLINRDGADLSQYRCGHFADMIEYVKSRAES